MERKFVLKDYISKYGNTSFEELPLNESDILVFATISYGDFMAVPRVLKKYDVFNDEISLNVFSKHETLKKISMRYLSGPVVFYNFYKNILNCSRYKNLRITRIRNVFSKSKNTQFFAMVCLIDNLKFIIYRGTDNTIPGWKEDVLTAIENEVPSQKLALEYIKGILELDKDSNYYIIGHSKGGNLAYYAFFNLDDELKKRIITCYNLDGNGFKNDKFDYEKYKNQIIKIVPNDDIVGTLFDVNKNVIVKSSSFSIFAHDVLTWNLNPKDMTKILRVKSLTRSSQVFKIVFNKWVSSLTNEEIQDFVDFVFMLVDVNKSRTVNDFIKNLVNSRHKYLKSIEKYPEKRKKSIKKISRDFLTDYFQVYIELSPITQKIKLMAKNRIEEEGEQQSEKKK